jgi:hypothetical protein
MFAYSSRPIAATMFEQSQIGGKFLTPYQYRNAMIAAVADISRCGCRALFHVKTASGFNRAFSVFSDTIATNRIYIAFTAPARENPGSVNRSF